jgi:hypothetical protein
VYDQALNMKNLHTIRKEVTLQERKSILPKSVWEKYGGKEFWRTPAPNFGVKQLYKVK